MSSSVTAVVLAGGEGRRIGGDKPLRKLGGERLIDRALRQARQWSECVAVSVRDPEQLGSVPAPLLIDRPDVEGPLAGLIAALEFAGSCRSERLLTLPADAPFLPHDLLVRLAAAIGEGGCAVAESGGHLHPVCALWRTSAAQRQVEAYLASGRRSLRGFAKDVGAVGVAWPSAPYDPFFNVNDRDDLAEAERRLAN